MASSRIFIRGLPPNLTEDEFRRHFSKQCAITDAKLIPRRRIGYVGYYNSNDASKAVKYFNNSFIRMSKIIVEPARSVEDQNALRSHMGDPHVDDKTQTAASCNNVEAGESRKRKQAQIFEVNENAKLQEYLEVMQVPSRSKIWANDDSMKTSTIHDLLTEKSAVLSIEGEYDHARKKPKKFSGSETVMETPSAVNEKTGMISSLPDFNHTADDGSPPPNNNALVASDKDWLRLRTSRLLGLGDDESNAQDPEISNCQYETTMPEGLINSQNSAEKTTFDTSITKEGHADGMLTEKELPSTLFRITDLAPQATGRLFVRNLSYKVTENELRMHFENEGQTPVEGIHIPKDYRSESSKGFAFVQYTDPKIAEYALNTLDGRPFQGRLIHIIHAAAHKHKALDGHTISKLPLKQQRQVMRKLGAASSVFKWNSLYMNADAVMSSISDRLGISKSDLIDPTSSNTAIKQAQAETHIIQENKAYFSANGVNLDAFKSVARSETAILVKNFAYGTRAEELTKLFEPYGKILKVLLPPSGTVAIVEFEHPQGAQSAFRSLAYRKFKDSVLFLEKAPNTVFFAGTNVPQTGKNDQKPPGDEIPSKSHFLEVGGQHMEILTSTLFVRNLNFSTTSDRLRKVFEPLDGFASATVKMKADPRRPGNFLSMGFGFLEFQSKEHAQAAMLAMDKYVLDGHELLIRASHKAIDAADERRKEDRAKKLAGRKTKIIIKNLPFEASKKDVRMLFSSYGQLRSVRVPKKFDSSTRGFAFADFVTAREAENAMGALKDTHLLGRKLVLDFAAEDAADPEEEIEKMQKKVGNQANRVALQRLASAGRRKFNIQGSEEVENE